MRIQSSSRLLILSTAILFSTGGAAIKACTFTSWQVAGFRCAIAIPTLWLLVPAARRRWNWRVVAVGAAYATTLTLFVHGNKLTTAANTIFLQATAPLYILLLGPWLLREPVRRKDLILVVVMGLGLAAFFVGLEAPLVTAPNPQLGNVIAALSGLTWALTIVGLRWIERRDPTAGGLAPATVVCGNVLALAVALPLAYPVDEGTAINWIVIVYLGVFQVGLAYALLTTAIRAVPALEASLLLITEPILSAVWAWLVHDERPAAASLAGGALIVLATASHTWLELRNRGRSAM